jgi:hypothetical protein
MRLTTIPVCKFAAKIRMEGLKMIGIFEIDQILGFELGVWDLEIKQYSIINTQ